MNIKMSQITSNSTFCSTIGVGIHERKHQISALMALCEQNPLVSDIVMLTIDTLQLTPDFRKVGNNIIW